MGCGAFPRQAVILAGGKGTRLKPITDSLPKPMVEFHGKPFLQYLIEQLRDVGVDRIVLLLGYLHEQIGDYFGDGRSLGVTIDYSVTAPEDDTGVRIRSAASKLDACFLLMYCDNYWPIVPQAMWNRFEKANVLAQITVYSNMDSFSKDNVRVDSDGMVVCYDKKRESPDLHGVEMGFAILRREVVDLIPPGNVNFEGSVYPQLVQRRQLSAFVTGHRYYSIGSHERLKATEAFLKRQPAVLLDRDGVLNVKPKRGEYVRTWDEFEWLPGAREALRLLKEAGYIIALITNQAGIARGMMTEADFCSINDRMQQDLKEVGAAVDAVYHCPHGWDENCHCRKPKPGMLYQAQVDFALDLTRVFFVGDDDRDREAAEEASCPFLQVDDEVSLLDLVRQVILT